MSDVTIKPLGDRVLVQFLDDGSEQVLGGIVIPDNAKETPQEATVITVGSGVEEGLLKDGDSILTKKYAGTEIKIEDETYKIYNTDDIIAIVG